MGLIKDLYRNKGIILNLAKNDFKNRFAGSYLGVFWAFVQPVVTVSIYWFVFEKGFKSAPMNDFPYLLWLIAGICPWLFFNDALNSASNSFNEYSYIVKKVVFKVSVLPVVKIISATFVHCFFIALVALIYVLYGNAPTVYYIQMLYYSLCVFALTLGIAYLTASISVFFKDLTQIVSIVLQFGMWLTPIMYTETMFPEKFRFIVKFNPMYYIVEGYRDSIIRGVGFWHHPKLTIYFWLFVIVCFLLGGAVFKKLKPHFADVL